MKIYPLIPPISPSPVIALEGVGYGILSRLIAGDLGISTVQVSGFVHGNDTDDHPHKRLPANSRI